MNEKYINISQHLYVLRQRIFNNAITSLAGCLVAGVIESAAAAIKICGTVHCVIVAKASCIDPTPGSANQFIRAVGNYCGTFNDSPATLHRVLYLEHKSS